GDERLELRDQALVLAHGRVMVNPGRSLVDEVLAVVVRAQADERVQDQDRAHRLAAGTHHPWLVRYRLEGLRGAALQSPAPLAPPPAGQRPNVRDRRVTTPAADADALHEDGITSASRLVVLGSVQQPDRLPLDVHDQTAVNSG